MTEDKTFTLAEAHKHFAIKTNGETWQLLEKKERTSIEDEILIHLAHASCYHWLQVGTGLHHQRAEWLLSHTYAEIGIADAALKHAKLCRDLTEEFKDLMQDFDIAYSHEAMARACACAGELSDALLHRQKAEAMGHAIADEKDRKIFMLDLNSGKWYGLN